MASPPTVGPLERALALRTLPVFHDVRPRQLAALAQHMREYVVPRGTILHPAVEPQRAAYLVTDGRVRLQRDGRAAGTVEAPGALGLIHLLAGQPPQATAIAETDVSTLVIEEAALLDVLEEHFSVVLHIQGVLGREIAALQEELSCYAPPRSDAAAQKPPAASEAFNLINCLLWLQRAPELRDLGVAVLAALLRDHRPLRYAAGDELFAAGAEASSFLVVVSGSVTGTPSSAQGRFRARPGDVLGRDAALAGLPYQYTAVAETPATAIGIAAQVFWDVAEDHFHVSRAALAMTARRLLSLRDRNVAEGVPAADPTAIVTDGTP